MPTRLTDKELTRIRDDFEGMLPDTCTLLTLTRTSDGQGGWTEAWGTVYENVPCKLTAKTGRELVTGGALQSYHSYTLTVPHDQTITPSYRVELNDVTYAVTSVDAGRSWIFGLRCEVEKI